MTEDMRAELIHPSEVEVSVWQDISTAPRDRDIIVCGHYDEPCVVRWDDYSKRWRGSFQGSYAIQSQGDLWTDYHETGPVTHWMPLPEPPNTEPRHD